ncbi:UNKNOWN [Stylonychia lemnae]|uniref:Uncharacterized protein n=1 Tax=Stylonychia lemnae TaxID=5949 RepID=A0A078AL92_STYLE|nr:UNKNOWN [Stylonychia lemnae]|eukprot:CDW81633.1 UNKNOWN [Stylonychia lemnae]
MITSVRAQGQTLSPKRAYFETVNQNFAQTTDPAVLQQSLNPLIKDYKLKPIYEIENNMKYKQMLENGSTHYRANFDNRNKIIWNNTDFRLFNRDNPATLDIMQIDDIPLKPVKDRSRQIGFENKLPEEDPGLRSRMINNQNLNNTMHFRQYGEPLPQSSYKDQFGKTIARANPIEVNQGSQRRLDDALRDQGQLRDTFVTVGPSPSQRYNSVVSKSYKESPFKSLQSNMANPAPQNQDYGMNNQKVQFQMPSQYPQQQQFPQGIPNLNASQSMAQFERDPNQQQQFINNQANLNNSMKSFLNVTGKYLDTSGRKPPSRHYQIDENTKKIYSTLYPEPGLANKFSSDKINLVNNLPHTTQVMNNQSNSSFNQNSMGLQDNPYFKNYQQQDKYSQSLAEISANQDIRPSYGSLIGLSRRIDKGISDKQLQGDTFSQDKRYYDQIMLESRRQRTNQGQNMFNSMQSSAINMIHQ